jgi:hypothetical protein
VGRHRGASVLAIGHVRLHARSAVTWADPNIQLDEVQRGDEDVVDEPVTGSTGSNDGVVGTEHSFGVSGCPEPTKWKRSNSQYERKVFGKKRNQVRKGKAK